jgi:DNA-binding NtrC family response regulator
MNDTDVLLVEGDRLRLRTLKRILGDRARVDSCGSFVDARARLVPRPPALLVTNSRLGAYSGLHLAYLAATLGLPTRVVVYDAAYSIATAREALRAGAFYVHGAQIAAALPGYLETELPPQDRRDAKCTDRRQHFRGGRRVIDSETQSSANHLRLAWRSVAEWA